MRTEICKVLLVFYVLFIFDAASKKKLTETQREYLNIFKNMPRLYEYILEALEDNPAILENNDVSKFRQKRNADYENDVTDFEKGIDDDEYYEDHDSAEETDEFVDNDYSFDNNDIEDLSKLMRDEFSNQDGISYKSAGYQLNNLTPDEIMEQAIKVEKMLEDKSS